MILYRHISYKEGRSKTRWRTGEGGGGEEGREEPSASLTTATLKSAKF